LVVSGSDFRSRSSIHPSMSSAKASGKSSFRTTEVYDRQVFSIALTVAASAEGSVAL
jgi:hypothetical protein